MFTGREAGSCALALLTFFVLSKHRHVPAFSDPNTLVQQSRVECTGKSPVNLSRVHAEVHFVFILSVFPGKQKLCRIIVVY